MVCCHASTDDLHGAKGLPMSPATRYANKQAKARRRCRLTAQERLARDRREPDVQDQEVLARQGRQRLQDRQERWDRDGTREALVRETQARLALLDGQPLQALPWLQEQMERLIVLSNRLAQHEERIRRVVMVNTCDTDAVLQDFLQTVRAWDAGRPHVPITRSVDTPQLSPCPCEQGAYDVPAARPVSRGRAAEHRPGRGPVSKAQWYLQQLSEWVTRKVPSDGMRQPPR